MAACVRTPSVVFSVGKFIAIERGELSRRPRKIVANEASNVKLSVGYLYVSD
jgi:hypothetical protein